MKLLKWPGGQYTLMKPAVGCPGGYVNWKEGSRYHDTEDDQRYNGYVVNTNMSGTLTFKTSGTFWKLNLSFKRYCVTNISSVMLN